MLSAQRDLPRTQNFAAEDYDFRMDIAAQLAERRTKLGYTPRQLADSAKVLEKDLNLVEKGVAFEGSHDVVCDALEAIERLETLRAGKAHLHLV